MNGISHQCDKCKEGYTRSYFIEKGCLYTEATLEEKESKPYFYAKEYGTLSTYVNRISSCNETPEIDGKKLKYTVKETGECITKCPHSVKWSSIDDGELELLP